VSIPIFSTAAQRGMPYSQHPEEVKESGIERSAEKKGKIHRAKLILKIQK
jgi:hypothetical protein